MGIPCSDVIVHRDTTTTIIVKYIIGSAKMGMISGKDRLMFARLKGAIGHLDKIVFAPL
jgi:hypothetical protein